MRIKGTCTTNNFLRKTRQIDIEDGWEESILVIRHKEKNQFFFFNFLKVYAFENVYAKGLAWIRKISKVTDV